ncbi:nuclear transport factor 2 family protein [Methylolobus aquaticus]
MGHTGSAGWIATETTWQFANGTVPFRISLVLGKEHGKWKIVQQHFSVGIGNDQLPL